MQPRNNEAGLDPAIISLFLMLRHHRAMQVVEGRRVTECAVCLMDYAVNDIVWLLTVCVHAFHPDSPDKADAREMLELLKEDQENEAYDILSLQSLHYSMTLTFILLVLFKKLQHCPCISLAGRCLQIRAVKLYFEIFRSLICSSSRRSYSSSGRGVGKSKDQRREANRTRLTHFNDHRGLVADQEHALGTVFTSI
ncbi:RING-H2 finger protein ATL28 [Dendrobium catenatum]|uniref:RING-H2 finger protein ATL28 n=1 Tax=Dendrobium catenatum TaxID=906689 RepID=A0A2I0X3J3_9ASPA|nr:RING-H2 finger protein ATL28 [Dendrobium catenatum]